MIQPIDNNITKATYNAVKLNIKKPEVNVSDNENLPQNGNFNAVNIDIDKPSINTAPKRRNIYEYPVATDPITYEMANIEAIQLPERFNVAYHTTNVILPKIENEVEFDSKNAENNEIQELKDLEDKSLKDTEQPKIEDAIISTDADPIKVEIPAPNYTTVEAEKNLETQEELDKNISDDNNIGFKGVEKKVPEIIPGEEIKPEVDIPLVISNLNSNDFDTQALQMEEIVRLSLDNKKNADPYIVRDVFVPLINITQKDSSKLQPPTQEQIASRKKIMTNLFIIDSANKNHTQASLPYEITAKDFENANKLSSKEEAERNKMYALYTISVLSKIYSEGIEKQTGNVVPFTDLPGSAAIVDTLRYSKNSAVKITAIDALKHIERPEYKEELNALFTLELADTNNLVRAKAAEALK